MGHEMEKREILCGFTRKSWQLMCTADEHGGWKRSHPDPLLLILYMENKKCSLPQLPFINEPHSSSSDEDVPVLLTTVDDNLLIIRRVDTSIIRTMVNLRKGSRSNVWSKSMPVLNMTSCDDKEREWKTPRNSPENFPSMKVRKWAFPSMTSLSRPSSNGSSKSAPGTSQDKQEFKSPGSITPVSTNSDLGLNRAFAKTDRPTNKHLSSAAPAMAYGHSVARDPPISGGSVWNMNTTEMPYDCEFSQSQCLRAKQKEFNRHFSQAGLNERVIDYYCCALVGDILLQGRLYITKNYFAFYSNVFGYVTKLLIPMAEVLEVSKEKTAKIIPNAVGISTEDEKHVFGSLLSRDSTYNFMVKVWQASKCPRPEPYRDGAADSASVGSLRIEDDSTVSGSGNEEVSSPETTVHSMTIVEGYKSSELKKERVLATPTSVKTWKEYWNAVKPTVVLAISATLLISLYLSAGFLLYRVAEIQNEFHDYTMSSRKDGSYQDILKWQEEMHSRSVDKIKEFLNANLKQILKVRMNLEALSMLILAAQDNAIDAIEKLVREEEKSSGKRGVAEETKEEVS